MTEEEWLNCPLATSMLRYLQDRISDRKARLFSVACCRTLERWFVDEHMRRTIEDAERFAEGQISVQELQIAFETACDAFTRVRDAVPRIERTVEVAWVVAATALVPPGPSWQPAYNVVERIMRAYYFQLLPLETTDLQAVSCRYAALLRDVVGNPFRLTPAVGRDRIAGVGEPASALARGMYESRQFQDMSVLADAIEEAGCTDAAMLAHCREPGEHVRGCWVLDLVLGKK